ncbi:MAG: ATP-dependent sacrificial sulfur transferase LarE [Coraliomargaritaceae bacterium]
MEHLKDLENWFDNCPGALVAFSGGVDSSLVAFLAKYFLGAERSLAVISGSPSLKLSDLDEAKRFALVNEIPLELVVTQEMENPDYFNNPSNRCYFCKHTLYDELKGLLETYPGWWILNGTNKEDLGDYRPGLQAASEFSVRSPLSDCGLDKEAVRALAAHFGLLCWNKPASPCLSSRVPYGERITVEKLRQIESGEALLKRHGFAVSRVRHYGQRARVEVPAGDVQRLLSLQSAIGSELKALGFETVEFDQEGFVSGKLNRVLSEQTRLQQSH